MSIDEADQIEVLKERWTDNWINYQDQSVHSSDSGNLINSDSSLDHAQVMNVTPPFIKEQSELSETMTEISEEITQLDIFERVDMFEMEIKVAQFQIGCYYALKKSKMKREEQQFKTEQIILRRWLREEYAIKANQFDKAHNIRCEDGHLNFKSVK